MKKLIAIIALTGGAMAAPAFAQSFDPNAGTGNVRGFSNGQTVQQNDKFVRRQSGLPAYALAPGTSWAIDSNSPAATGGGSEGYNPELLMR
jgi:hypothetical protein